MHKLIKQLEALNKRPTISTPEYEDWLDHTHQLAFLQANANDDDLVVYAVADHIFFHTVFVPTRKIKNPDVDDLLKWNGNAYSSWGLITSNHPTKKICLEPPLHSIHSETISSGEQLIFARSFDGLEKDRSYIELLQKFVHISDIHYVRHREAWCMLDENGDLVDMAKIVSLPPAHGRLNGRAVIINRRLLDQYAVLTNSAMVRMFDLTHFTPSRFSSWDQKAREVVTTTGDLIYRRRAQADASYARGVQLIRPKLTKAQLFAESWLIPSSSTPKRYASFIAQDLKNNKICEISCAPEALSNYFTKSDKPFEITPAFFRPEVLLRYKADPQKYTVESRSISCRGAWHLETYDINEAGQVHTYLVYLSRLPHEEQQYWRSFNEEPKAPISDRAFKTDFLGEFSDADPLGQLKHLLGSLDERKPAWWTLRDADLIRQLTSPVTAAPNEWANDVMNLDKAIIEGFEEKYLRKKAQELGRTVPDQMRALKLLEECLIGLNFAPDHAHALLSPFHEVHNLRSEQKGHPAGETARKAREAILEKHKTFRSHFDELCRQCLESLTIIDRAFQ
jgi:hypothetical protein